MGKTKNPAWRNTERLPRKQSSYSYNSKTKECAWRNTNTQIPNKKLKPTQKLRYEPPEPIVSDTSDSSLDDDDDDDDDDDVVIIDPKQKQCELAANMSPMSDSLLNDDDDAELSTSKQEHRELVENLSLMSDSVENNSSFQSEIVYVQGYKVKQSIATILEAIFKKHGDIAANCVFKSSSTRTHFLEIVCEIVKKIQTNDMTTEIVKDINRQLSDAEAANINVSWIRAHFDAFHKRKETCENYNMLMEMKSNTILVKQAAQMDLRETCAELMSAQERFINAERCVRVLHLVEKNINDNILESKAKLDSWVDHSIV